MLRFLKIEDANLHNELGMQVCPEVNSKTPSDVVVMAFCDPIGRFSPI